MLAFWIELKRRAKVSWAVIASLAGGAAILAAYLWRERHQQTEAAFERSETKYAERVAVANARAAIEIHTAQNKESAVRAELVEIDKDPDGDRRRQKLIELAARVEGTKS